MRKHFKFIPREGLVFEDLKIEITSDEIIRKLNNVYFKVKCLSCGKLYEKPQHSFFGKRITRCQCQKKLSSGYKGFGEVSSVYFNKLRRGAEERKIAFDITKEGIWERFLAQEGRCTLTGLSLIIQRNHRKYKLMTASLDRIDSSKGYTSDNVQWIHKDVNRMKVNFDEKYFVELCKLIVKYDKTNSRKKGQRC
jgi:hypothetical protein